MTQVTGNNENTANARGNTRVALLCAGIVVGMVGMAYAAVPLYDLFCRVTGYGGTTQTAENSYGIPIVDREITVRFDANISRDLDWKFTAVQRDVTLKLGEQMQIAYTAENTSDVPLTGSATFNVTPQAAGAYFNKIECFCFTETTLEPGEKMEMPVVFFVDPDMLDQIETKDIQTITLSYTFFPMAKSAKPLAEATGQKVEETESQL